MVFLKRGGGEISGADSDPYHHVVMCEVADLFEFEVVYQGACRPQMVVRIRVYLIWHAEKRGNMRLAIPKE